MESISTVDLEILRWVQNLGGLEPVMRLASLTGSVEFYLLFVPALYWCWNATIGLRLGVLLMASAGINEALKVSFHRPRPFWVIPNLTNAQPGSGDTNFGFPSGHAQNAAVLWGFLAAAWPGNRRWPKLLAATFVAFVGISRVYLGVHSPTDVLAGWAFGALLLWGYLQVEEPVQRWLRQLSLTGQMLAALLFSLLIMSTYGLAHASLASWELPASWSLTALSQTGQRIEPLLWKNVVDACGVLMGMGVGAAWIAKRGGFAANGPLGKRLARYVLGIFGLLGLWLGLRALLPQGDNLTAYTLRYLRSGMVGAWVAGLAPALFIRLSLAERGSSPLAASQGH